MTTTPAPEATASVPTPASADPHLPARLREAWHKTVGTWATDEKTTASLVKRLVEFGTLSSEEAKKVLADAKKRVEENKAELDRRVDDSLAKATTLFSSEQREMKKLEERIAELEARLVKLSA